MSKFFQGLFEKMFDKKAFMALISVLLLTMLQAGISFLQSKGFEELEESK